MYAVSFIIVRTTFENQVRDSYAFQKVQVFSNLRTPETHFRQEQGYQPAGAIKGFINIVRNTTIGVSGVQHKKTVIRLKNLKNGLIGFHK